MTEVFLFTVPYKLLVLFCAQAHGALGPGRLCFICTVQCMGTCCRLGPGLYLQSGFTSEGLTLKVSEVAQSCSTLCDPVDSSPPGSSIHGILQASMLEWVVVPNQGSNPGLLHCRWIPYL